MPTFDLVIRNGMLIDGTGSPAVHADVGVVDGRVVSVGRVEDTGREELDAEGHVVTPGFVDGHTHMDAQVFWDPLGTSSCWHGVTSVVMGNCGFTLAPVRQGHEELVVANLERAEDISRAAMAAGVDWGWSTFPEYLDAVDHLAKAINVAAYVGHSALRTWAMGERAFEESATDDDMKAMAGAVRDAIDAGAVGLSTSRSIHETADDRPVASRRAEWDEVVCLTRVLGDAGSGLLEIANEIQAGSPAPDQRAEYLGRLRSLAIDTGVPITFGLQPARRGAFLLELADQTAEAGGSMFGQSHSRGITSMVSFRTQMPFDRLPEWRAIRSLPDAEQMAALQDREVRSRLVAAANHGDYGHRVGVEPKKPDYEVLCAYTAPYPPYRSVASIAAERGIDPVEAIIDLALESELDQLFSEQLVPDTEDELLKVMKHPRAVMTFSDSGAHVSQIVDCSIHTYLLGYWVRQRQAFTLEEAVRMLSGVPARAWGLPDRGVVRPGRIADLNVFDPVRVGPAMPRAVTDLPAGAKRLVQESTGFLATVVGGQITIRDGQHTGALPGRLLRGPFRVAVPGR